MADPALTQGRYCPICNYDLRANTTGRCPECGTLAGYGIASQIPWARRRFLGGRRAYLSTLGLLMFRPWVLAEESRHRISLRPAKRFHHESLFLATAFFAGLITIAFLLRGPSAERWLNPDVQRALANGPWAMLAVPMFVLSDSLWMLVPLAPAVYGALVISTWFYRVLFAVGARSALERRRTYRIGYYASGMALPLAILLGTYVVMWALLHEENSWIGPPWSTALRAGELVCLLITGAVFYFPTVVMLRGAARAGLVRCMAVAVLCPLVQMGALALTMAVSYWIAGYVAIAVRSYTT